MAQRPGLREPELSKIIAEGIPMNRRSLRNGAVVAITLGALTGVGTMVANASTRTDAGAAGGSAAGQRGNDPNGDDANGPLNPGQSPSPFDPRPSASASSPNQDAGSTNACTAVQVLNTQQNGDAQLCTTVQSTGLRVNVVRVSLTVPAGACQGNVTLQATMQQGNNQQGTGALTDTVNCDGTGRTVATFNPGQQVANGSQICGTLVAGNRLAAARACVRIAP